MVLESDVAKWEWLCGYFVLELFILVDMFCGWKIVHHGEYNPLIRLSSWSVTFVLDYYQYICPPITCLHLCLYTLIPCRRSWSLASLTACVFSKIDLKSGYHQICVRDKDVRKTDPDTRRYYEFLVLLFRLTNTPATFQALMNQVFRSYLRKFLLVFFDGIHLFTALMWGLKWSILR